MLDDVSPSEEEKRATMEMFSRIQEFVDEQFGREAELMGSTAKGTFMAGDKDLDIFVFFDTGVAEEELEEEGLEIGEAVFKEFGGDHEVEYAEHPYTKGEIDGYEVEIVPAYRVDSGEAIKSSVDRTPFHREWVEEQLSAEERKEVLLLKAFLRGQELYGSTLRVQGFSGYLCELLIAEYGSFMELLEDAVDWEEDAVIDPADHHGALPNHLKKKFEDESLVVVDPVDPERNVASVLSHENYARFVYEAWRYLQEPSLAFFFPDADEPDERLLRQKAERRGDFVMIEFPKPDLIDDMLYPQLRSLLSRLDDVLEDSEFRVFHAGFHVDDEVRILFELFSEELPKMRKHDGPRVFHNQEHLENFSQTYGEVWVEDDRLTTVVERAFTSARDLLRDFLSEDLGEKGVPRNIVSSVEKAEVKGLDFEGESWRRFLRDSFHLQL